MDPNAHFNALVDLLVTVAYIDGTFDRHEKEFVRRYLDQLVAHVGVDFDAVYTRLEAEVAGLAAEVMDAGDDRYVSNRLKVRAVALFRAFAPADQAVALELVNGLVTADGSISAIERRLIEELVSHFVAIPPAPTSVTIPPADQRLQVEPQQPNELAGLSLPLLEPLERTYAQDASTAGADYELVFQAIAVWERQRARGNGRLKGITDIGQLPLGARLLDGHVHVMRPDQPTELIVLGDLHGCYSCLKGALLQSDFIERVRLYQADPITNPNVILVLLGDYLDRGRFGFEGVLRAALKLLVTLPNHVVMLRGNHEYLLRHEGKIVSAVQPAEAIPAITPRVSLDMLESYRHLFEHMPTSFLFDRTLFVHAGIPRDETLAQRYRDLSSLDDAVIRFEMMWSDPVETEHVPADLQRESTRFTFGREQFRAVMERIGCTALIRGHEQVNSGFQPGFDVDGRRFYTLFSAGGHDNPDLPETSRYRSVTPMALSIRHDALTVRAIPWPIQYQPFCTAEHCGLYRP